MTLAVGGEVAPGGRHFIEAYADLVSGAADAVVLEVDLPTGVSYVPADAHTSVGRSCRAVGQLVTCRDEQPDVGGGTAAGGFLELEVGRDVPVGTVLGVAARAGVEGATDPDPGNDAAAGSFRVVAERNVAISWGAAQYSARAPANLVVALTVVNHGADPVETGILLFDPEYADGTPGHPRSTVSDLPPDQPGRSCFSDPGSSRCTLTLEGGQQDVLEYVLRIDPADAGHTLSVHARSETGSLDGTVGDDVSVTRIVVGQRTTASTPAGASTGTAPGAELAATGSDARVTAGLAMLGIAFVTGGAAALRFSRRAAGPRRG